MPALTRLAFRLSASFLDQITPTDSPLFFSNLLHLTVYSEFLDPISRLLSQIRLPAITDFIAWISVRPSKQDVSVFLTNLPTSLYSHTIHRLQIDQGLSTYPTNVAEGPRPVLRFKDLQPCMTFSNLRSFDLNVEWDVELTDSELLKLASAWPHLERFFVNPDWGWRTRAGITPGGLVQLLETHRSLSEVALAIDTRGYAGSPPPPASFGFTLPPTFSLDVIDSNINPESVPAIAAFLADIAPCANFSLRAWEGLFLEETDGMDHWDDAYERANHALRQRS